MNASKTIKRSRVTGVAARRVANWGVLMVALGQTACDEDPTPWAILDGGVDASVTTDAGGDPTTRDSGSETTGTPTDGISVGYSSSTADEGAPDASTTEPGLPDASVSQSATSSAVLTSSTGLTSETLTITSETSEPSSDVATTETSAPTVSSSAEAAISSVAEVDSGLLEASCEGQCSADCFPDCLAALLNECAPAGECRNDSGSYCWDDDVTATQTGNAFNMTRNFAAADGAPCFSVTRTLSIGVGLGSYTWRDGSGSTVATGSWDMELSSMVVSCTEAGTGWNFTFPDPDTCSTIDSLGWTVSECEAGSCSAVDTGESSDTATSGGTATSTEIATSADTSAPGITDAGVSSSTASDASAQ